MFSGVMQRCYRRILKLFQTWPDILPETYENETPEQVRQREEVCGTFKLFRLPIRPWPTALTERLASMMLQKLLKLRHLVAQCNRYKQDTEDWSPFFEDPEEITTCPGFKYLRELMYSEFEPDTEFGDYYPFCDLPIQTCMDEKSDYIFHVYSHFCTISFWNVFRLDMKNERYKLRAWIGDENTRQTSLELHAHRLAKNACKRFKHKAETKILTTCLRLLDRMKQ